MPSRKAAGTRSPGVQPHREARARTPGLTAGRAEPGGVLPTAGLPRRLDGAPRVPLHLLAAGVEEAHPRYHGRRCGDHYWRFYVVDRPGLHLFQDGRRLAYLPSRIMVIPGCRDFTFAMTPGVVHGFLHVDLPSLPVYVLRDVFPDAFHLHAPGLLRDLRRYFHRLAGAADPDERLRHEALVLATRIWLEIFGGLDRAAQVRIAGEAAAGRFTDLLGWIEGHLDRAFTIGQLAAQVGMPRAAFNRQFRQEVGASPLQFILGRRIARVAWHLADPFLEGNLDSVARRCGLGNRSYLSRVFAERYGMPPLEYRRANLAGRLPGWSRSQAGRGIRPRPPA